MRRESPETPAVPPLAPRRLGARLRKAGLGAVAAFGSALALAPLTIAAGLPATTLLLTPAPMQAQAFPAFRQALAEGVAADSALAAFYRETNFEAVWTGAEHATRRTALVSALSRAREHGLPGDRYDLQGLLSAFEAVESERDRGFAEARASQAFMQYARDISSGVLEPGAVISQIVREVPRPDARQMMHDFAGAEPVSFIRNLAPSSPEYARLFHAKRELEATIARGGWGPRVPVGSLSPGQEGQSVIALRNRLIAMGYMPRLATASYDATMQRAVQRFQEAHGLEPNGIANNATISAINVEPQERLRSVVVALERERWTNIERGERHIMVNLTDFHVRIMDDDQVTFVTPSIIGQRESNRQTPEFSDHMTYIEINPDWTIPRSLLAGRWGAIASGRYELIDARGNRVSPFSVDFSRYTPRTLPFNVRQPPGPGNPLGEVKFMFPNPYAIYLHDTPERHLFRNTVRTHSAGCVRLNDPQEFAYELLSRQFADPVTHYQHILRSGQQTRVYLENPVPIHIVYRTAFTSVTGELNYRDDVYGRDARIYDALRNAGVPMPGLPAS
ncbi:MAG: L,D-transpeptidase family protein [Pararhodobacter sp.]|nr:L,D-transpeptidase family protein [Pararhodobacter sp.]